MNYLELSIQKIKSSVSRDFFISNLCAFSFILLSNCSGQNMTVLNRSGKVSILFCSSAQLQGYIFFIMKGYWVLSKTSSVLIEMFVFFPFILCYIILNDFCMFNQPYFPEVNYTWSQVCNPFYMWLVSVCQFPVEDI